MAVPRAGTTSGPLAASARRAAPKAASKASPIKKQKDIHKEEEHLRQKLSVKLVAQVPTALADLEDPSREEEASWGTWQPLPPPRPNRWGRAERLAAAKAAQPTTE